MKLVSWNVNGIRACVQKGFLDIFNEMNADIFCLQETKMQEGQLELELPGYYQYWNYAVKKGYSGTLVYSKVEPVSVKFGIDDEEYDGEGRVITLDYKEFYLVNVYVPNAKRELEALKGKVPGLLEIKLQTEKLPSSNADMMLDSAFETEEALAGYQVNPLHVAAATYVRSVVDQRLCLDFEA